MRDNDILFLAHVLNKVVGSEDLTTDEQDYLDIVSGQFKQPGKKVKSVDAPEAATDAGPVFAGTIVSIEGDFARIELDNEIELMGGNKIPAGGEYIVPLSSVEAKNEEAAEEPAA